MRRRLALAAALLLSACGGGGGGGRAATGPGPGTFTPGDVLATGVNPTAVVAADLDGDGRLDLAVANLGSASVSIFLGTGGGHFAPFGSVAVGPNPNSLSLGDLDGARADLTVVCSGDDTLWTFLGLGNGTFAFQQSFVMAGGGVPGGVAVLPFDAAFGAEVAVTVGFGGAAPTGQVRVFPGNGDGTTGTTALPLFVPFCGLASGLATGDVDGDGRIDLVTAHPFTGGFTYARSSGAGTWISAFTVPTGSGTSGVALARLDGDGLLDYASTNANAASVSIRLGRGAAVPTPTLPSEIPVGPSPWPIAAGDFNGDGRQDLAVGITGAGSESIQVLLGRGDGTFDAAPALLPMPGDPASLCVGDFDGNGRADLAACDFDGATLRLFLAD